MEKQDPYMAARDALEDRMEALHDWAYEIVMKHWEAVRSYERQSPGWENWSTLQLPQITYSSATAFLSDGSEDIEIIDDEDEV